MKSSPLTAILVLIILTAISASAFFFYQSSKLQNQLSQIQTPTPTTTVDSTTSWKKYVNSQLGFSFSYPGDLEIEELKNDNFVEVSKRISQDSRLIFNVSVTPYSSKSIVEVCGYGPNPKSEEFVTNTSLDGISAKHFFAWGGDGGYWPDDCIVAFKNNKTYRIHSSKSNDTNPKNEKNILLNQILSTFKFLPTVSCKPRPACLDATPPCKMPETPDMCPAP